jgi:amidohydrolase
LGCQAEITIKRITPALVNDMSISERVQVTARHIMPEADLRTAGYLTMGAEDAAFLLEKVNGCFFFVGSANKARHLDYGHHHPRFDFDEEALIRGSALMAAAAVDLLNAK